VVVWVGAGPGLTPDPNPLAWLLLLCKAIPLCDFYGKLAGNNEVLVSAKSQRLFSRASQKHTSCPAHAPRTRASCLPESATCDRDGLAHSRSISTARHIRCAA